tara:strand:- start:336 stop:536 length:201 start_codon:yes stop_codon:yes gene_type:complete
MTEEKLYKVIMKVHGLIPCKEEEEYIEALQYLLDNNLAFDISEFVNDITNMYLAEKKLHISPEKIN